MQRLRGEPEQAVELASNAMGVFFIDTAGGAIATVHQLIEAGITEGSDPPPRPWLRIQGSGDATTMWYAVMRRRERGIYLGTLVMRYSTHHELLLSQGWEEIHPGDIGPPVPAPIS
ncbi:MAG: hypothetical protein QOE31_2744 [Solirubrobacteraceae bacterium]|nr:hypothetical protein [Solirubrobacteraceae bacterium]